MPTTYSTSLRLSLIATGEQAGTWGNTTNTNLGTLLEQAITGYTSISMTDANYTLSISNGASDESRNANIKLDGGTTLTATRVVIIPNANKTYYFWNATNGSQTVVIATSASPTTYVGIPNGYGCYVFCDGANNVYQQSPFINATTGAVLLGATSVTTLSASSTISSSSTVTGTSLIPSGATIPSNGIYLPAANTVGVSTSSTARFYFGPSGQIGIGGATYGTAGQVLTSGGASAPPTWGSAVTSVGMSFTGGLVAVSGSPVTSTGTFALTVAGTSGGIPYFSSASTWASSGALAANAIVIGGGAGVAPSTTTTGTGVLTALGNTVNAAGGITTPDGTATLTNKTINGSSNTITNVSLSTGITGTLPVANGGIGNTSTPTNGQVPIGDGTKYVPATLTAGTGISITNASGSITIASSVSVPGVNVQTFTSAGSNTWTKPSGYAAGSRVFLQAWGAGGGGGRGSGVAGGGGGGYNERWLLLSDMGATETVTIGTGGAARTTNGTGNDGTNTTVGSLLTAYAGSGGGGGGGQLSAGSSTSGGLPKFAAYFTDNGTSLTGVYYQGDSGFGIATFMHGAGGASSSGVAGNSFWGGGGGGSSNNTTAGTSKNGGSGGAGSNASNGTAGSQPGGGGGATNSGTSSGKGGDGQVIITVFPA